IVRNIYQRLVNLKLEPWFDLVKLPGGITWPEEIRRAIQQSTFFLPHFSPNSIESFGVFQEEIELAHAEWQQRCRNSDSDDRYHLIPLLLENGQLPLRLKALQGIMYPLPQGNGEHVLVVDTDRGVGERCVQRLSRSGYTPFFCNTLKK